MIDKLEKKLYYNTMTYKSIFIVRQENVWEREKYKKTEKKENIGKGF